MPKRFLYIFGGVIGDGLLGIHLGRTLSNAVPGARLHMISTRENRFFRELLEPLPFVSYEEMPKNRFASWLRLLSLMLTSHVVIYWVPFRDPASLWWRIIARVSTLRRGSIEVHCQINDREAPPRVRISRFDCKTENIFSTVVGALHTAGIPAAVLSRPYLSRPKDCTPPKYPYVLFHFFAASYRRSVPTDHARSLLLAARALYPRYAFILTCAQGERERAERMAEGVENIRIEAGLHAHEMECLLTNATLCVGAATGITQIGAHLSVPSILLCNLPNMCWLPSYNPDVVLLYELAHCGCRGEKDDVCSIKTPEGPVYRCLYDIKTERIIEEMQRILTTRT